MKTRKALGWMLLIFGWLLDLNVVSIHSPHPGYADVQVAIVIFCTALLLFAMNLKD